MYRTVSAFLFLGATAMLFAAQHPAPFVDELAPTAIKVGALNSIVRLRGAGFSTTSFVRWQVDGVSTRLLTFFKGPTRLEAEVPFWLTASATTATLTVENPGSVPGPSISNSMFLPITMPTNSVALAETTFGVGENPNRIVSGDFNGDGNIDIATSNNLSNDVSILLGDGAGNFYPAPVSPAVGAFPVALASGDFNGDGKIDLALANLCTSPASCPDNGTVTILLSRGDGTFSPAITTALSSQPSALAVGDFNRDGKLDLAVAQADRVAILLGKNDGAFTTSSSPASPSGAAQLVVGDFNNDGNLDLALGNPQWAVLLGKGNGAFAAPLPLAAPSGASQLVAGDFNHDGKLDLVITYNSPSLPPDGYIAALLGDGNGAFTTGPSSFIGHFGVTFAQPGDFNGDGKLDLATSADYPLIDYAVVLGRGDGSFTLSTLLMVSNNGNGPAAIGDFNADGRLDIAATNEMNGGEVAVLIQQPVATLSDTTLNFGDQKIGSRTYRSATLTASTTLHISGTVNHGGHFGLVTTDTSCPFSGGTLAAGKSCTIDVVFTPPSAGSFMGLVTLIDDSGGIPNSQQTITFSGSAH